MRGHETRNQLRLQGSELVSTVNGKRYGIGQLSFPTPAITDVLDACDRRPLGLTTVDGTASWPHDHILHAWWVQGGRLLAGEYPFAWHRGQGARKLRLLAEAGVGAIVDLTTEADGLLPYVAELRGVARGAGRTVPAY